MINKDEKQSTDISSSKLYRIRITLTSQNVAAIERVSKDLIASVKNKREGIKISGPRRMPVRTLSVTTRKSPCGEGTKTWDRFEMKFHKHVIDVQVTTDMVPEIVTTSVDPNVEIELTITSSD